jgi:glycosyltransferase involved in cell wall biosynthesis
MFHFGRQIKIAHVIPTLSIGGAERFVVDLANMLDKNNFKSDIIIFKNIQPFTELLNNNINVHLIEKKGKLSIGLFFALRNKLKLLKPDIVHTNLFGADVWGRLAAASLNIPVVTTEHNINVAEGRIKHFIKRILRYKSRIYSCPSNAIKKYMMSRFKISGKDIHVIRYGIDLNKFKCANYPKFIDPVKFLIIGRLVAQKGHSLALRAFSELKHDSWELDIIGQGELKNDLKRLADGFGIKNKVSFLNPVLDPSQAYKKYDIVLVPSLWEGLGLVVMEAMASGRLVLGSAAGGIPELISHNKTGFLFQAGDCESLTKLISWCLKNKKACSRIANAGHEFAVNHFALKKMVEQYEDVYGKIIKM